jgi:hypothetical protein
MEPFGFETFYFKRNIFRDFPSIPSNLNLSEGTVYKHPAPIPSPSSSKSGPSGDSDCDIAMNSGADNAGGGIIRII